MAAKRPARTSLRYAKATLSPRYRRKLHQPLGHCSISQRIDTLRADEDSPERQALHQEYQELSDRKWLVGVKDDVIAEIGRKKQLHELKQAIRDTRQNEITTKSTELAEALVTDRLRGRFPRN